MLWRHICKPSSSTENILASLLFFMALHKVIQLSSLLSRVLAQWQFCNVLLLARHPACSTSPYCCTPSEMHDWTSGIRKQEPYSGMEFGALLSTECHNVSAGDNIGKAVFKMASPGEQIQAHIWSTGCICVMWKGLPVCGGQHAFL
jgi:hypothetical protein